MPDYEGVFSHWIVRAYLLVVKGDNKGFYGSVVGLSVAAFSYFLIFTIVWGLVKNDAEPNSKRCGLRGLNVSSGPSFVLFIIAFFATVFCIIMMFVSKKSFRKQDHLEVIPGAINDNSQEQTKEQPPTYQDPPVVPPSYEERAPLIKS
eukprot:m.95104 g.95104  ORF g.95104 m.95104 type:complete len:148 (-) comp13477_c0_seq6:105-548(-)